MEKFTNDNNAFIAQGKKELFDFPAHPDWVGLFQYVEMPYFLTYAFSVQLAINNSQSHFQIRHKVWNTQFDLTRFSKGIFNLSRLAVIEKESVVLLPSEVPNIPLAGITTKEITSVVLDGLICEMKIPSLQKHFTWNIDKEMNDELDRLVTWIRKEWGVE